METLELTLRPIEGKGELPTAELVDLAEIRDGRAVVKLSATEAGLAALRSDLAGKTYDLTTTAGDKAARADRLRCVTLRTTLEKRRKELKAPALEFGKLIDAEAKRITDEVTKLEAPIDAAIKADEERRERERQEKARIEAERVAKLRQGLETIRGYVLRAQAPGMTAERIAKGIVALESMTFSLEDWQEFTGEAASARDVVLGQLRILHDGAVEREAEAKRLADERAELERQAAELKAKMEQQPVAIAPAAQEGVAENPVQPQPSLSTFHGGDAAADAGAAVNGVVEHAQAQPDTVAPVGVMPPAPASRCELSPPADAPVDPKTGEILFTAPPSIDQPGVGTLRSYNPEPATPPTLKLGAIGERLGFALTQGFIEHTLGIKHAGTDKRAVLYHEADWPRIKAALIDHIRGLA